MLDIKKTLEAGSLNVVLDGRLDTTTATELEQQIKDDIEGVKELTFDMEKLDYISSAGLRVLLSCQKIMSKQGNMVVKNVSEEVMEIFEVTGFSDILTIE